MYETHLPTEVTFKISSCLLVNAAILLDQLEPDVKSAWGNLSPTCGILDFKNFY